MCVLIAVAAVAWAWFRMGRHHPDTGVVGNGSTVFWAVFGVLMALGTFTMLFIVLIPGGLVMLLLSKWFEPVRSWLVLAGLVVVPAGWMATGAIDGGVGGWVAVGVGAVVVGLVGTAFEMRQRRTPARPSWASGSDR
jgi:hypothetical protein